MKPAPFAYHRVERTEDALELLAELGDEAKVLAGGQSLVPMMNFRLARPPALVDISRIPDLRYVERDGDAPADRRAHHCTATVETARRPGVVDGYELLPRAARWVGHYPIRTRGHVRRQPRARRPHRRVVHARRAARRDGRRSRARRASARSRPPTSSSASSRPRWSRTSCSSRCASRGRRPHAALQEFAAPPRRLRDRRRRGGPELDGDRLTDARIVLGGVDEVPLRVTEAEEVLAAPSRAEAFAEAGQAAAAAVEPSADIHGSADYRKELTGRARAGGALAEAVDRR